MKKIVPLVALGLVSLTQSAIAGDIGFGVSAKTNDGYIYLPIKVGSSYIVEPYIGYHKSKDSKSTYSAFGESSEDSFEDQFYGVGLFRSQPISEKFGAYYGLRLAYAKHNYGTVRSGPTRTQVRNEDLSGYAISPTFGIEYKITDRFLVSFEAEYRHIKYDGKGSEYLTYAPEYNIEDYTNEYDALDKRQYTDTRVLVRYFF